MTMTECVPSWDIPVEDKSILEALVKLKANGCITLGKSIPESMDKYQALGWVDIFSLEGEFRMMVTDCGKNSIRKLMRRKSWKS